METKNISDYGEHRLTNLVPTESLDIALYFSIHICKLAHLHIHEFSLNLFLMKSRKPSIFKFVYISIFNYFVYSASHFLK